VLVDFWMNWKTREFYHNIFILLNLIESSPFSIKTNQQEQIYRMIDMKEKILKEIDSFVNMCYTMFKIGAGDFAKENFPRLVENFYDENRSDEENYKAIKDMFELNIVFNQKTNEEVAKTIQIFLEGWYDKIKI
jgi:hypothetical protein